MFLLPEYGTFRRIFVETDFQQIPAWHELIYDYLKEDSIPPLPFKCMVERYPEGARRVFKAVLKRPQVQPQSGFSQADAAL